LTNCSGTTRRNSRSSRSFTVLDSARSRVGNSCLRRLPPSSDLRTSAARGVPDYEVVTSCPVRKLISALAGKRAGYQRVYAQLSRDPCAPELGAYRLAGPLEPIVCGVHLDRGYRLAFSRCSRGDGRSADSRRHPVRRSPRAPPPSERHLDDSAGRIRCPESANPSRPAPGVAFGQEGEHDVEAPFTFLGPVTYVDHRGERPVALTWKLPEQMP